MTIIVRAEFEALSDQVSAFRTVALALSDAASEEPGTLRYAWYAGDTPSTFVVIEEYVDDNAALVHNERCGDLLRQAGELAQMKAVHLHGDLGPDLTAWVAEHAQAQAHPPVARNV